MKNNNKNKISYYDLEDLEKVAAIDNIDCSPVLIFYIIFALIFFAVIIYFINILSFFSNMFWAVFFFIIQTLPLLIIFFILKNKTSIFKFNPRLTIDGNTVVYTNHIGEKFTYEKKDIQYAKLKNQPYSKYFNYNITIYMSDNTIINIPYSYSNFYKLIMYLEQENLFRK